MKKKVIFISLIVIVAIIPVRSLYFKYREFMGLKEVCKRWGDQDFDLFEFKRVGREGERKRAKMTCSLIRNKKKYIGKDVLDIKKLFGNYTGYYFNEAYPTYLIESAKKDGEDSWQIVFLIDKDQKIKNIVVHKNCCGSWKKELLLMLPL